MQAFIELWRPKPAWLARSQEERAAYLKTIEEGVGLVDAERMEIVGWGRVSESDSGFEFFSIWRMQDESDVATFRQIVADSGWYEYFEHVNISGELRDPVSVLSEHVAL